MIKILLIEDDLVMARLYEKIFTYEGFEMLISADGESGISSAKKDKPTIILLDLMMPKMDGLKVLEVLKHDPETKEIPVLILTNLGNETIISQSYGLGACGYLLKSEVGTDKIVDEVRKYIKE